MFTTAQIEELLAQIDSLLQSAKPQGEQTMVDSTVLSRIFSEAAHLRRLNQRLLLGRHEHRHGDSLYLFLVPQGVPFDEANLSECLQEDFEPGDERLSVDLMDAPTIISTLTWVCPKCGHQHCDTIEEDGPFGELYCDDCMAVAQRPDLTRAEVAAWDRAIKTLRTGEARDLGMSYVRG